MPRARTVATEQPSQPPPVVIHQTMAAAPPPAEKEKREEIDFWSYLRGIAPAQWREYTVYLYRTRPIVGINQREKYLAIYQQPFTVEDVKKTYGGEEFRAILNRGGSMIKQVVFAIEAAPIYDNARETPRHADATAALNERLVDKVLNSGAGANPATNAAVEQVVDMMGKGFDAAIERIGKAGPGGDSSSSDSMKLVLAMMQSQTQIVTTLIASLVKDRAPVAPAADPKSALKDSLELFAALREFAGENGGGKRSGFWENLAEQAVNKAPELIREVRSGVTDIGRQRLELEHARRGGPVPPPQAMAPQPVPITAGPAMAAPPPEALPRPQAQPQISEDEAFERLSARHIVKLIFAGEPADVVMQFLAGANRKMYEAVLDLDQQGLRMVITADPILSQLLQYPQLDVVLDEIVQYAAEEKAALQSERDTEAAQVQ